MTQIHQPHDKLVKKLLSNKATARDVLSLYLPPEILAITNLDILELQRDSFIDDEHRTSAVDLLYKTDIQGDAGYLWILIEHQRRSDYWMPLRLFRYMGVIWEHIRRTNRKRTTLPLIIPLVIYNGNEPYAHSLTLSDLLAPESVRPLFDRMFTQPFPLVDLATVEDETLREQAQTHVHGIALLMALKHAHDRHLKTFFEHVMVLVLKHLEKLGDGDIVVDVLYYLLSEGQFLKDSDFKQIIHREFSQQTEDNLMTIAQQLEQRGLERGLEKGKLEGKLEIAEILLKEGQQIDFIERITKLTRLDILALEKELSH
jgi:predicted transposase/invertase (TIGR01784 family)